MTKYFNAAGVESSVGDQVKVLSTGVSNDANGMGAGVKWRNVWVTSMNDAIGRTYTIKSIDANGAYFKDGVGMGYPINVLENLSKQPTARVHGLEVGDVVRVLTDEGSSSYTPYIGQELVVSAVIDNSYPDHAIIECFTPTGVAMDAGQWPSRYKLVRKAGVAKPFGVADLKDGQRVVTQNGKNAVVYTGRSGNKLIGYVNSQGVQSGYDDAQFDKAGDRAYFSIVKVFEQPQDGFVLHLLKKGDLAWTNNEAAIAEADAKVVLAQKAVDAAETASATAATALRAANNDLTLAKLQAAAVRK